MNTHQKSRHTTKHPNKMSLRWKLPNDNVYMCQTTCIPVISSGMYLPPPPPPSHPYTPPSPTTPCLLPPPPPPDPSPASVAWLNYTYFGRQLSCFQGFPGNWTSPAMIRQWLSWLGHLASKKKEIFPMLTQFSSEVNLGSGVHSTNPNHLTVLIPINNNTPVNRT